MSDSTIIAADDLEEMKMFLRVDTDTEDALIGGCILAAKGYMHNAGIRNMNDDAVYKMVERMLVALFFEHRDTATDQVSIPPVINHLITQLAIVSLKNSSASG